ncbi:hypothetical protein KY330_05780 [Candidatus Woesearchaeota archaeon]|nr:hypothetical protein [Candidatus Woesearchaeota archaeon]
MNLALNPFDKGKRPELVEEVKIELDEAVEEAYKIYDKLDKRKLNPIADYNDVVFGVPTLSPAQIQLFLNKIESVWDYRHCITSYFLSELMQKSYESGFDDFALDIKYPFLRAFMESITVPLSAKIYGDLFALGNKCNGVKVEMYGNVSNGVGSKCTDSKFVVHGDIAYCGLDSKNCTYYIDGNVTTGDLYLMGKQCTFFLNPESYNKFIKQPWASRFLFRLFLKNKVRPI